MTTPEQRLMEAVVRMEGIGKDVVDIKLTMRDLALAFTKLAVFDERQAQDRGELTRVFKILEGHNARIDALELAQPLQKQSSDWVQKAIGIVVAAVISAVLATVVVSRTELPQRASAKTEVTR
jgi:hypothetical protein